MFIVMNKEIILFVKIRSVVKVVQGASFSERRKFIDKTLENKIKT